MKNILITGGNSGIGLSCYKLFNKHGYNCYIIDLVNNGNKNTYQCDVSNIDDVNTTLNIIKKKNIKFDAIITCAVYQEKVDNKLLSCESFKKTININIFGVFNICRTILNYKMINDNARFIIPLSIHSNKPRLNHLAYDISKAGLEMFVKEMALTYARDGITFNGVSFGAVRTELNKNWINDIDEYNKVISKIPMNIILSPDEIASFIYNMTTDNFKYCTGSIYEIDGGRHLM